MRFFLRTNWYYEGTGVKIGCFYRVKDPEGKYAYLFGRTRSHTDVTDKGIVLLKVRRRL